MPTSRHLIPTLILILTAAATAAPAESPLIQADGFERGDACLWSARVPADPACAGETLTLLLPGNVPLEMVRIHAGSFLMGAYVAELNAHGNEYPQHQVTISQDFYISRTEVTQAQWLAVTGDDPTIPGSWSCPSRDWGHGPDYPVYCVPINQIIPTGNPTFLPTLDAHLAATGQPTGVRLPTEAEWEYAARAGTTTRFSHGDALSCDEYIEPCELHDRYMWWAGNKTPPVPDETTQPVASKLPNPWGLFDMHGNVHEWVSDYYTDDYYANSPTEDPQGPDVVSGAARILRGGSFVDPAHRLRSATRYTVYPYSYGAHIGFRIVLGP